MRCDDLIADTLFVLLLRHNLGEIFTRDCTKEPESIRCQHLPRDHRLLATDTHLLVSIFVSLLASLLVTYKASCRLFP